MPTTNALLSRALHAATLASIVFAFGCGQRYHTDDPEALLVVLEAELDKKNDLVARLTAHVEEKTQENAVLAAELERTQEMLEYAETQFINLEQGLKQQETKASAVAALAEAQMAYENRLRADEQAPKLTAVREAEVKLAQADDLLTKNRFAASVYYSQRAVRLLDESFPTSNHIRVVSVQHANMRSGPGMGYNVVARLPLGTLLFQFEGESHWFRVETTEGKAGWIHESVTVTR